jgi:hypothetical protein
MAGKKWELHEILAVVMLLDAQGWARPSEDDPAWVHMAEQVGRPVKAVICRAREVRTADPNYDRTPMNYSTGAPVSDKRVVDAYLFAQRAATAPASI